VSTSLAFDIIARDRASQTFDKVGNSADRSSGKLKKWAKVGAVAVAAGSVLVAKGLFDATKAAIADEKAQVLLAKQLKNSARATDGQVKSTERWITKQGIALGVTDDELRPALGRLVAATHDVGKAQKLASLAMDISAGTGKSLKTVTEALVKAQNGSVGGLSRLGVATKNADGSTKSLKKITEDLSKTYSGQAATAANTTEGKFARLKLMFYETKESIGARLIPVALKLADWIFKFAPKVQSLAQDLSQKFGPALRAIGEFIGEKVIPVVRELAEKWLSGVKKMFDEVGKSVQENRPFLEAVGKAIGKIATVAGGALATALGFLYKHGFPLLGKALGAAITGAKKITTALLFLGEYGVRAFSFLLNAALATFGGILSAADKGLGWIPGLGDKIHNAKESFDRFREATVNNLEKTADKLHMVRDKINGIKSPPPVKIDVKPDFSTLGRFQAAINGLHGKSVNIYANLLTSGKGTKTATNSDLGLPGNARGTGYFTGGRTVVGEYGPEVVDLPRGSRIHDAARSQKLGGGSGSEMDYDRLAAASVRALERGTQLVRLPDAGREAFRAGAAY
jgi:hypothetical protein